MAGSCSTTLLVAALLAFLANAEGFFLYSNNKKTSTDRVMPPQPHFYRDPQPLQSAISSPWIPTQQQYTYDSSDSLTTVALPVAVPIQSQMRPMPSSLRGMVHNVQLVPCLCPVSRDMERTFAAPNIQQNQQSPSQQQSMPANVQQPSTVEFSASQQTPSTT